MNSLNQEYPWRTKLSSAGLVYFYFGHRIISHILNLDHCDTKVKVIFKKMYENFIEEIDAIDNGISICGTRRTRDPNKLKACDIVVDVGFIFDPSLHRYDHNQRSFNENMNSLNQEYPWRTKLSSAGLVYFYFGHRIISHILNLDHCDTEVKVIFKKMYEHFIEGIDAIDNYISICGTRRYAISINLSSRVKMLNPQWNSVSSDSDNGFRGAMELVGMEFMYLLLYYSNAWWPAIELLQMALKERCNIYSTGEIIELKNGRVPWEDHLFWLENELGITPTVKFVIYPSSNGEYIVQCVPIKPKSSENRISLLEEWKGLCDRELTKISGIPGCVCASIDLLEKTNQEMEQF